MSKILSGALAALFIATVIYHLIVVSGKNDAIKAMAIKTEKANLALGRAETKIMSLENAADLFSVSIQNEIKARKAKETLLLELQAKLQSKGSGSLIVKEVPIDKIVYINKEGQSEKLTSLPFEFSDFRLHLRGDAINKKINYELNQSFSLRLVETKLKNGSFSHYAELFEIRTDTKDIVQKLELSTFTVVKAPPEIETKHFDLFNMNIDISLFTGANLKLDPLYGADIGISLMSYGLKDREHIRLLRLGIGLSNIDELVINFAPVTVNLGKNLPIFTNIWLIPSIGSSLDSNYFLGIGLGAKL